MRRSSLVSLGQKHLQLHLEVVEVMVKELEADLQKETFCSNFQNDQPTFVSGCASIPVQLSLILGTGNVSFELTLPRFCCVHFISVNFVNILFF